MNTKCPQCGSPYNVTEAHIGRKFKCKNCSAALVVTENGVEFQSAAAAPAAPKGAFDFDAGGGADRDRDRDEEKPRRPARAAARRDDGDDYQDDRPERLARRGGVSRGGGGMGDFLAFRKMVIPLVIQIIFWFLVGVVILGGLGFAVMSVVSGKTEQMLMGVAILVFGVPVYILLIRMYCELVIVIFRINDTLTDIKNALERQSH
jgi:predicted Zn finger-like uncharacterized protein